MNKVYGTVGYTYIKSPINYILVLADIHSQLSYCDNSINIDLWLKNNMQHTNILLEEVPRDGVKLNDLWNNSSHTQKLKEFFLQNPKLVHATDIRPYLIPYSWELCKMGKQNISLKNYLEIINKFFNFEIEYFKIKLGKIYSIQFLKNTDLGTHFNIIQKYYQTFLNDNHKFINNYICDIYKNNRHILENFNELLDTIMEWYSIAKIFQYINNKKNVIIHTGLFHSERIIILLTKHYGCSIIDKKGINTLNDIEYTNKYDGCIDIPLHIEKQLKIINN
jgi:hypothetical protein